MAFAIIYSPEALDHLRSLPKSSQVLVLDEVDEQLAHQPILPTRKRNIRRLFCQTQRSCHTSLFWGRIVACNAFNHGIVDPIYSQLIVRGQQIECRRLVKNKIRVERIRENWRRGQQGCRHDSRSRKGHWHSPGPHKLMSPQHSKQEPPRQGRRGGSFFASIILIIAVFFSRHLPLARPRIGGHSR